MPEHVPCPCCAAAQSVFEREVAGYRLERCSSCGFVYVNPRPTAADLTRLYVRKDGAAQADFYEKTVSPAQIQEYDRILADIKQLLAGDGRLLDLGCAAGYFMQRAFAAGFEAHGVDLATWVEQIARERGVPNVRTGGLREMDFPTAWFDAVHSSQVFEHLPNPKEELAEIRRILRPGGILYVNVPNYRCLSIVLGRDDFELNTPPEHVSYFTPRTIATLVASAGFDVVRTSSYGGLKWENLLGRPIRSEIAEAVRPSTGDAPAGNRHVGAAPQRAGVVGRIARNLLYGRLQVGMTLEALARRI